MVKYIVLFCFVGFLILLLLVVYENVFIGIVIGKMNFLDVDFG